MTTAGQFVLENQNGEVVRTFGPETGALFLIYRHDTRRVEVVGDLHSLKEQDISFDVLKKTSAASVRRRAVKLSNGSYFRWRKEIEKTASLVNVADDSTEQEKTIYKYTALTQIGVLLIVFIIGLLIEPFFVHKKPDPIVTVVAQNFVQKQPHVTVKAAVHKVVPHKKYSNHRVKSHFKHVTKRMVTRAHARRKENAHLRTRTNVEHAGVLGVLGGMQNGSKNSAGFNYKALNDSRGSSWSGAGHGGVGGMERAIHGQGLVAATAGRGNRIEGGGGYGTRGKAGGGRPGYGKINLGGTAAAYFEPVKEEALVEGGLDREQIAAVINRHIGEVIYCYERGLQVNPKLNGRIGVHFVINGSGIVSTAGIESSSLHSSSVEGCVVSHLRTWRFPHPVGGVNVKVSYPFVLKRLNHG